MKNLVCCDHGFDCSPCKSIGQKEEGCCLFLGARNFRSLTATSCLWLIFLDLNLVVQINLIM